MKPNIVENKTRERIYHAGDNKNFTVAICDNCFATLNRRLQHYQYFSEPKRNLDMGCDFCKGKKKLKDFE